MTHKIRLAAFAVCLFSCWSVASAVQAPISVFPNPVQFGIVPINLLAGPLAVFVSNSSGNSINVTGTTISGANSSDFAFYGPTCVGVIPSGQTCQMSMTFTPSAMGNRAASLVVVFKGPGSPLPIPLQGFGGNPLPTLTSLSPPSAYVGNPGFTLTANGSGFVSGSTLYWENNPLTTTYVSGTQVTAPIPASFLTNTNSYFVVVGNPAPGGGFTGSINFNVVGLNPQLGSISPTSLVAGSAPTSITVNGGNFLSGTKVLWNGKPLSTTYVSVNQLQAQLTTAELGKPQIAQVSISNPPPGGISATQNFNVTFPATVHVLDLPANDLVWDPYTRNIYASLPSSFGTNGNTIAVINPSNGSLSSYNFAGSEPTALALSQDAKYLYVGLNGSGSVQRFVLPGFTPDININLGSSPFGGLNTAGELQVSPGDSHTFAVSLGGGCCGGPLEFFKDSTLLPNSIQNPQISSFQFASASTLYGYAQNVVSQVTVDANGGTVSNQWNLITGSSGIQYDAGLIYGESGQVLNPQTGQLVGVYDVGGNFNGNNYLIPESVVNRTFVFGTTPFSSSLAITSYDLSHFVPLAVLDLSQLSANATPHYIRWGSNGLAFVTQTGCCGNGNYQLATAQSSMMLPVSTTKNPVPSAGSLSPSKLGHGGNNFKLTVNGSGFVPGSQVTWNGKARTVTYVSASQLTVYIPGSDVASKGIASVVITNPAPGGGKSSALTFTIN